MTPPKKRIGEMSDDEMRVAIAVATGKWELCSFCGRNFIAPVGFQKNQLWDDFIEGKKIDFLWPTFGEKYQHLVPSNYPTDLNAMHEAEKCLTVKQCPIYSEKLDFVLGDWQPWDGSSNWAFNATAQMRARAFLLTLGHEE